jgi:hypothetical protein
LESIDRSFCPNLPLFLKGWASRALQKSTTLLYSQFLLKPLAEGLPQISKFFQKFINHGALKKHIPVENPIHKRATEKHTITKRSNPLSSNRPTTLNIQKISPQTGTKTPIQIDQKIYSKLAEISFPRNPETNILSKIFAPKFSIFFSNNSNKYKKELKNSPYLSKTLSSFNNQFTDTKPKLHPPRNRTRNTTARPFRSPTHNPLDHLLFERSTQNGPQDLFHSNSSINPCQNNLPL